MPERRRIWCETLPFETLLAPGTVALLRRSSLAPIVAVWPSTPLGTITRVLGTFADAGLAAAIWPMLDDADGRWASAGNAEVFARFACSLVEQLADARCPPTELFVDLEPAIEAMRSGVASSAVNVQAAHYLPMSFDKQTLNEGEARFAGLAESLIAQGVVPSAAVAPMVLLDPQEGAIKPWQERLGTPVDGPRWGHVSVMFYTSIFEGWSRGALRREDTRQLLGLAATATATRFGERGGLCVGAVGTGAFGNEPVYRDEAELRDDVGLALAAGVRDLSLFDLGGVLKKARPEAWIAAFTDTEAASSLPEPGLRLRSLLGGARLAGGVLGAMSWLRDTTRRP